MGIATVRRAHGERTLREFVCLVPQSGTKACLCTRSGASLQLLMIHVPMRRQDPKISKNESAPCCLPSARQRSCTSSPPRRPRRSRRASPGRTRAHPSSCAGSPGRLCSSRRKTGSSPGRCPGTPVPFSVHFRGECAGGRTKQQQVVMGTAGTHEERVGIVVSRSKISYGVAHSNAPWLGPGQL